MCVCVCVCVSSKMVTGIQRVFLDLQSVMGCEMHTQLQLLQDLGSLQLRMTVSGMGMTEGFATGKQECIHTTHTRT